MNSTFLLGANEGVAWGDFIFYIAIFIILMALIKKFAWAPIVEMMEKRADKIANDLDSAQNARKDAEKLAQERDKALKDSRIEASRIIDNARQNGEKQKEDILTTAQKEATDLKNVAKKDIQKERKDAMDSVKNDVAKLSIEIASKIIQKELTESDQKALVDSYIEGLGKHGNR